MSELVKAKPVELLYGFHTEGHSLDLVASAWQSTENGQVFAPSMYAVSAKHLRNSPSGKVALFFEDVGAPTGYSDTMQRFIAEGILPHLAYPAARLVHEGVDPAGKNFLYRTKLRYDAMKDFGKSGLMIANKLHHEFPGRVEMYAEEHSPEEIKRQEDRFYNKYEGASWAIVLAVFEGRIKDAARLTEDMATSQAYAQSTREQEILDQMTAILSKPDIIALSTHYGQFHSSGLSKGLSVKGFAPHSIHLFRANQRGGRVFEPQEVAERQVKDGGSRVPELYWHYIAIEQTFFETAKSFLGSRFDSNAEELYVKAIEIAEKCMEPFGNFLFLRRYIEQLEEQGTNGIMRRFSDVLDSVELPK